MRPNIWVYGLIARLCFLTFNLVETRRALSYQYLQETVDKSGHFPTILWWMYYFLFWEVHSVQNKYMRSASGQRCHRRLWKWTNCRTLLLLSLRVFSRHSRPPKRRVMVVWFITVLLTCKTYWTPQHTISQLTSAKLTRYFTHCSSPVLELLNLQVRYLLSIIHLLLYYLSSSNQPFPFFRQSPRLLIHISNISINIINHLNRSCTCLL